MKLYLGIDTSNYTTSVALSGEDGIVLKKKIPLEVPLGERGIRQREAVFSHTLNLPEIMECIGKRPLAAIGCASYPRDIKGSYMPCFKAGEGLARSIGAICGIPVHKFSHQAGHIAAAAYSAGCMELLKGEFIAFHVSGGTTEILRVNDMHIECLGGTLDINAGQAIDRTGVLLGMKFPCGPELEVLAEKGRLPKEPKICVGGFECNLSGLENKVKELISDNTPKEDIAFYTIEWIKRTLDKLSENIRKQYDLPILYTGGVMSNRIIKSTLALRDKTYFAEPEYSCDNAAGIALLTMGKERDLF